MGKTDKACFFRGTGFDGENLGALSPEDRSLIIMRFFRGKTQAETAKILGFTQVGVSRRERKILAELREKLI